MREVAHGVPGARSSNPAGRGKKALPRPGCPRSETCTVDWRATATVILKRPLAQLAFIPRKEAPMLAFATIALALLSAPPCTLHASLIPSCQEQETIDPCSNLIRAWVDPEFGVDGPSMATTGSPLLFFPQVNDIDAPFRTIQYAINALEHHLVSAFNAGNPAVQGLVYALPGIYGPSGNGEFFPIHMRDRVHVQGQGARGCVIRGLAIPGSYTPTAFVFPVGFLRRWMPKSWSISPGQADPPADSWCPSLGQR